jgi:hypothetical protein
MNINHSEVLTDRKIDIRVWIGFSWIQMEFRGEFL